MHITRIHFMSLLTLGLGIGCSHRNIRDDIPTHPRRIVSVATTNKDLYVLTSKEELYRLEEGQTTFQTLKFPEEIADPLASKALQAVGKDLYIIGYRLAYSADGGQSWRELTLPLSQRQVNCFAADPNGQIVVSYSDKVWYAAGPDSPFKPIEIGDVNDCQIKDKFLILRRGSLTDVRSLSDPQTVIDTLHGSWLMKSPSDESGFYYDSYKDGTISRYSPEAGPVTLPIPYPDTSLRNMAVYDDYMAVLTWDSLRLYQGATLLYEQSAPRDGSYITATGRELYWIHENDLERIATDNSRTRLPLP